MATDLKVFFKELIEYNHYCNQQLAELIVANEKLLNEKVFSLFSHILNAHQVWNNRISAGQPSFGVWDLHPTQLYGQIDKDNNGRTLSLIDQYELDQVINYSNTRGQQFSNSVKDILYHAINHSNYHRAQIATEFKQVGRAPLSTDYIFFKR